MAKRTDTPRYSQNSIVGTFAVGIHRSVGVTKGRLVVVGGKGSWPIPHIDYDKGWKKKDLLDVIKTRTIKLPDEDKDITVDVLLIKHTGEISVEAILKEVKGRYTEVTVYMENEVRFYDGIKTK